jgi:uncharacterized protein (DUF1499 family)
MARSFSAAYKSEPISGLASWARRLAVFSLVAAISSIAIVRFGFLEVKPALFTFFGALAVAGLSILVAFAGFAAIWQNGSRGMSRILFALMLDAIILAYPAYLFYQYRKLPAIYDVTTDPIDPPRYEAIARLRGAEGANPAAYAGLYSAERQRIAYPEVEPITLEVPAQQAYDAALSVVKKRKWLILVDRAPQLPRREGKIEAIARTPIMGFREDIAIRVLPDGEGSRIDLRSSSRYFDHDLGTNASRITRLIEDINEQADNIKPAKKQPSQPKALPKTVKK